MLLGLGRVIDNALWTVVLPGNGVSKLTFYMQFFSSHFVLDQCKYFLEADV